ncbi:hypothetical protein ACFU98_39265 [Streptomyces sp. NPDC057575]|uniref:hypothetical protein n=1 Tax=unclassified Streptomyces TaxID=2593676 RepID=UPI003680FBD6
MKFPTKVALAQAVTVLPEGPGWWYEAKLDGHRTVLRRGRRGSRIRGWRRIWSWRWRCPASLLRAPSASEWNTT